MSVIECTLCKHISWNYLYSIFCTLMYCTNAVRFDGSITSVGEGLYGRLDHGGSESETKMRTIIYIMHYKVYYLWLLMLIIISLWQFSLVFRLHYTNVERELS